MGFVEADDEVYKNTRKMILEKNGNPYYLTGSSFNGIGGPHIGLQHAWPMSVLIQAMTSDDDDEIMSCINAVKNVSRNGLIHESIHVEYERDFTRMFCITICVGYLLTTV
jgi:meiotically up-regulated gene 157 (Mug157) protein